MLVKVYDAFPWLMYGKVRQPCLELQRDVPAGGLGVLSFFASFAPTMFLKHSVDCRMGCFLRSMNMNV